MVLDQAENIDYVRREVSAALALDRKSELGQYMTPSSIANFMASMFCKLPNREIRLLDAGAGIGSLTVAFLERFLAESSQLKKIDLSTYEIDPILSVYLKKILSRIQRHEAIEITSTINSQDFIEYAIDAIQFRLQSFTHAILNPPYKKIHNDSRHRKLLRAVGIETVNLYTAFLALSILLLEEKGELVAIIPRSFCNGPYYKSFRKFLLKNTNLKQIHIFESRGKLFQDDGVLQENVIVYLCKEKQDQEILISYSSDSSFSNLKKRIVSFEEIVHSSDTESFIHIPTSEKPNSLRNGGERKVCYSLGELGIEVSTGPVVDFRIKDFLLSNFEPNSIPLIYPCHFENFVLNWPKINGKKANALTNNEIIKKWLYPNGFYAVVKRFSSKEETKRVKAFVYQPSKISHDWVGFENHLNIFHKGKTGLEEEIAFGLMVYLNSSFVDGLFRQFNGHTQINATDLRLIKYPSLENLYKIGSWSRSNDCLIQESIDACIHQIL